MKITVIQTTTKMFTYERILLSSVIKESFLLEPDTGKILKNKKTGRQYPLGTCIVREKDIVEFEEISIPNDSE